MTKRSVPYLVETRPGRFRWIPGPALRRLGFKGRNLQDPSGQWLSEGDAIMAARALNEEAAAARENRAPEVRGLPRAARTVEELWERYTRSSKFTRLAPKTQADYRNKSRFFREGFVARASHTRENGKEVKPGDRLGSFSHYPVLALTGPAMHGFAEDLLAQKGKHMTLGVMAVFRRVLKYAEIIGWRAKGSNPAAALELPRPRPRLRLVLPEEVEQLVASADALGKPSVGDAIILALHSGQREMDTLSLPEKIIAGRRILLTQSKRGAAVDIPMTPACKGRMEASRARKHAAYGPGSNIATFAPESPLIVCERTNQAYRDASQFNKDWLPVRAHAAARLPSCASVKFLDLRDTAVTRLAMAGCTKYEIASITGHALGSIDAIMKHYLVLNSDMADAGIAKLVAWMQREGIAI